MFPGKPQIVNNRADVKATSTANRTFVQFTGTTQRLALSALHSACVEFGLSHRVALQMRRSAAHLRHAHWFAMCLSFDLPTLTGSGFIPGETRVVFGPDTVQELYNCSIQKTTGIPCAIPSALREGSVLADLLGAPPGVVIADVTPTSVRCRMPVGVGKNLKFIGAFRCILACPKKLMSPAFVRLFVRLLSQGQDGQVPALR